jgi:hypothetical protein
MRSRFLVTMAAIVGSTFWATAATRQYQYLFPRPGMTAVSAQTDIILRQGDDIDSGSLVPSDVIVVTGSKSGHHPGKVSLSDDGKTVLFLPNEPFSLGEEVSVHVRPAIKTKIGGTVPGTRFRFTVSSTPQSSQDTPSFMEQIGSRSLPTWENTASLGRGHAVVSSVADSMLPEFPEIQITTSDHPPQGCLFLTSSSFDTSYHGNYLMILDPSGQPVFARRTPLSCADFKIQPNGLLTYFDNKALRWYAMDSTYVVVDSFKAGNGYPTDLHDLLLLPNGHAIVIAYQTKRYAMDTIVAGGSPEARVRGNILQELDSDKNVIFQWRSWDYFAVTDATHEDLTSENIDYVHSNAVDLDTDGNILLSSRHMDEITKISRQTGEIIWRIGGKHNEFKFLNDSIGFSHQHAIRNLGNGHYTLFDNGNYHTPSFSRAVEYVIDEKRRTIRLVWQYRNTPDTYTFAMGYVQRLDDGNTLIGWGSANPTVTLVSPEGEKLYELTFPAGVVSYRAYVFPWQGTPITDVQDRQAMPVAFTLEQNFPNPFNPSTEIRYSLAHESYVVLTVFNPLGQQVALLVDQPQQAGSHSVMFDGRNLASGVYYYRMWVCPTDGREMADLSTGSAERFVATKKLLLLK